MKQGPFITILLTAIPFLLWGNETDTTTQRSASVLYLKGNQAYEEGRYEKAVHYYEAILARDSLSASLFYNLGNAAYKANRIGLAVWAYEQARERTPTDEDVQHNLDLARQRVTDKFETKDTASLQQYWETFLLSLPPGKWAAYSLWTFLFCCGGVILYFTGERPPLRKTGFFTAVPLLVLTLLFILFARQQTVYLNSLDEAIIMAPQVTVRNEPAEEAPNAFVLHEGAKVRVTGEKGKWLEVEIPGGNVGWMPRSSCRRF